MTTYRAWNLKPLDRSALKELTAAIAQQSTEELENRAMETMDGEPWSEEKYQMTLAAQQKEAGLLAGILAARGIEGFRSPSTTLPVSKSTTTISLAFMVS